MCFFIPFIAKASRLNGLQILFRHRDKGMQVIRLPFRGECAHIELIRNLGELRANIEEEILFKDGWGTGPPIVNDIVVHSFEIGDEAFNCLITTSRVVVKLFDNRD